MVNIDAFNESALIKEVTLDLPFPLNAIPISDH